MAPTFARGLLLAKAGLLATERGHFKIEGVDLVGAMLHRRPKVRSSS